MATALQMGSLLVSPPDAPVQVEWLPWHHTMGSNVILHSILKNGGTLYIDDGRPLPQLFHKTVANLKEISPTAMFNVPAGYNLLCDAIENDLDLGASVFRRMDRLSYAGAAISQGTLEKLYRLTSSITGRRIRLCRATAPPKRPRQSVRPIGRRTSPERLVFPHRVCS